MDSDGKKRILEEVTKLVETEQRDEIIAMLAAKQISAEPNHKIQIAKPQEDPVKNTLAHEMQSQQSDIQKLDQAITTFLSGTVENKQGICDALKTLVKQDQKNFQYITNALSQANVAQQREKITDVAYLLNYINNKGNNPNLGNIFQNYSLPPPKSSAALAPFKLYNNLMQNSINIDSGNALHNIKKKLEESIAQGALLETITDQKTGETTKQLSTKALKELVTKLDSKEERKLFNELLRNTERTLRTPEEQRKKTALSFLMSDTKIATKLKDRIQKKDQVIEKLKQKVVQMQQKLQNDQTNSKGAITGKKRDHSLERQ